MLSTSTATSALTFPRRLCIRPRTPICVSLTPILNTSPVRLAPRGARYKSSVTGRPRMPLPQVNLCRYGIGMSGGPGHAPISACQLSLWPFKFKWKSVKQEEDSAALRKAGDGSQAKSSKGTPPARDQLHQTPAKPTPVKRTESHSVHGGTEKLILTEEQKAVMDLVVRGGKSIFFTGAAGTGKSFLLRKIIERLMTKHSDNFEKVAITASTGIAATYIGGRTLHSFSGIGIGKDDVDDLVDRILVSESRYRKWVQVKVLIIDEISMVEGGVFDKLEYIARKVRKNKLPFGGIQLVVAGDFFQLPPVLEGGQARFAFEADTWDRVIQHKVVLGRIFRQKDPTFTTILNEMREGCLSAKSIQQLKDLISRPVNLRDGLQPSKLFALRWEVDKANRARLNQLSGDLHIYNSQDWGAASKAMRDQILSGSGPPQQLRLKKGAQVMLTKNLHHLDPRLSNGTLGQVIDFVYWGGSDKRFPLVRFTHLNGSTQELVCAPTNWIIEGARKKRADGSVTSVDLVGRRQIPLILAWALSIHKAQGKTLDFVQVDLTSVFERHQAYVALSRATSMKGLQVLNFSPEKVFVHEKVRHFYKNLTTTQKNQQKRDEGRKDEWW